MKLLTTTEAARLCGVSPRTLLRWLTSGEMTGVRTAGGHWRLRESDLAGLPREPGGGTSALRVVIIEDEPGQAQALATLVSILSPGARVERAEDGLAAGLLLAATRPHVAFVDIEMPLLDGIDVIRRARALDAVPHTRFVVVSGRLTEPRIEALRELGVRDILNKPIRPEAVETILGERGSEPAPSELG